MKAKQSNIIFADDQELLAEGIDPSYEICDKRSLLGTLGDLIRSEKAGMGPYDYTATVIVEGETKQEGEFSLTDLRKADVINYRDGWFNLLWFSQRKVNTLKRWGGEYESRIS